MTEDIQKKERIVWVDTAKGFGMFLVVLGHLLYDSSLQTCNQAIYSFHMPMFFVLSGFVAGPRKNVGNDGYYRKKFQRLLLPAVVFIVLTLPLYYLSARSAGAAQWLRTIFYVDGVIAYNTPCWYLIVLFYVAAADGSLQIARKTPAVKAIISLGCFAAGFVLYRFKIFLPFGLDRAVIAMGFYGFGSLVREAWRQRARLSGAVRLLLWGSFTALWLLFGVGLNGKVAMYSMELGNYVWFVLAGCFGALAFFGLCICLASRLPLLRIWGNYSILMIGTQSVFLSVFARAAAILDIRFTWKYDVLALVAALALMWCYMSVGPFINRWLPLLNGNYIVGNSHKLSK